MDGDSGKKHPVYLFSTFRLLLSGWPAPEALDTRQGLGYSSDQKQAARWPEAFMKKDKKTKLLLKRLAAIRGREREALPRPAVFEDGKKYRREREKQRRRRWDPEE